VGDGGISMLYITFGASRYLIVFLVRSSVGVVSLTAPDSEPTHAMVGGSAANGWMGS